VFGFGALGKLLILLGVLIIVIGLLLLVGEKIPWVGRLPGDIIIDELVKSHIPYVVHASTKPVLSEPFTLRQAQGERWVEAPVLSEPFVPSRASGRTVSRRAHASASSAERNINRLSRASRDSP